MVLISFEQSCTSCQSNLTVLPVLAQECKERVKNASSITIVKEFELCNKPFLQDDSEATRANFQVLADVELTQHPKNGKWFACHKDDQPGCKGREVGSVCVALVQTAKTLTKTVQGGKSAKRLQGDDSDGNGQSFHVFPNPASNRLWVKHQHKPVAEASLRTSSRSSKACGKRELAIHSNAVKASHQHSG